MTFETDADRLAMIRALGGVVLSTPTGNLDAVLNEGFAEATLGPGVEGVEPYLECRTSDYERLKLAKGLVLTLGARTFKIVRHEPDGTGMSRVIVQ